MKNTEEAYATLWNVLTNEDVNLASIANVVLKEPPTGQINTELFRHAVPSGKGKFLRFGFILNRSS